METYVVKISQLNIEKSCLNWKGLNLNLPARPDINSGLNMSHYIKNILPFFPRTSTLFKILPQKFLATHNLL